MLHSSWGPQFKWICNPVLSCHSCALAYFACPIGVFTQFAGNHVFPFIAFGTVLILGILLGRLLCGWICPFGFLQDLLFKIKSKKIIMPAWTSYIKYLVLIFMVLLIPYFLGGETFYSFCRICPAAALQSSLPGLIASGFADFSTSHIVRFSLLVLILAAAIFSSRAFCKVLCPIGAILAPLNLLCFWAIKIPEDGCVQCGKCSRVCVMDDDPSVRVLERKSANRTLDCVVCHECQDACPLKKSDAKKQ